MTSKYDYHNAVNEDAQDIFDEYIDSFTEEKQPCYEYTTKNDFTNAFYQWVTYAGQLHEWVDTCFYSYEAEDICDYTDNLESDTGIWDGLTDWRRIRDAIAFCSLKADIWFALENLLEQHYDDTEALEDSEDE